VSTVGHDQRKPAVVTIGVFDGVHLGHQQLLGNVVESSRRMHAESVCVTFDPHPDEVLRPGAAMVHLTSLEDRLALVRAAGITEIVLLEFTLELAQLSPEEFMGFLLRRFQLRELWVGSDFALGKGRSGSAERLAAIGAEHSFRVIELPPVEIEGQVVSSSRIRRFLADGQVESAAQLLGRPHRVAGEVVRGDGRGRGLGFPTANVAVDDRIALPGDGVYAVTCSMHGHDTMPGVASIGVRPTFDGSDRRLEVHLLGFDGDLYGQRLSTDFVAFLRGEERFESAEELIRQMREDARQAEVALRNVRAAGGR
jgi:riboflavin kinase / FMN adenylyltransferase